MELDTDDRTDTDCDTAGACDVDWGFPIMQCSVEPRASSTMNWHWCMVKGDVKQDSR